MTADPADLPARCSTAARLRGDALPGTASTVRAFLLLEDAGPWGVSALRDARLPEGLGPELLRRCGRLGIRPLLIRRDVPRRGGTRAASTRRAVLAAYPDPRGGWLESGTVDDPRELLDLDLGALAAGTGGLLARAAGPVFGVCTHGRHDACCAERGRPVLRALAAAEPEATWAVSHLGGDRFAANLLILGDGLYYGGLDPESVLAVAQAHRDGRLHLPTLRGRTCWPMSVQAAEVALRRHLDDDRLGGIGLTGRKPLLGGDDVAVRFTVDGAGLWDVVVRPIRGEPVRLTCSAQHTEPALEWRAFEPVEVGPPAG